MIHLYLKVIILLNSLILNGCFGSRYMKNWFQDLYEISSFDGGNYAIFQRAECESRQGGLSLCLRICESFIFRYPNHAELSAYNDAIRSFFGVNLNLLFWEPK